MSQQRNRKWWWLILPGVTLPMAWQMNRTRACGPFFPNVLLTSPDESALWAPTADFAREMELLKPAPPPFRFVPSTDDLDSTRAGNAPFEQTAAVDVADVAAALEEQKIQQRELLLANYRAARASIAAYATQARSKTTPAPAPAPGPAPVLPKLDGLDKLPAEFTLYLRGAIAYHEGQYEAARAAWQKVLELPADQRQYRSTWAAFMLAKVPADGTEFEKQVAALQRVRELAGQGFRDSLGLAAASYGWEAKAHLAEHQYEKAIPLYLVALAAGDPTATMSLRDSCAAVLRVKRDDYRAQPPAADAAVLKRLAADGACRHVMTAYFTSLAGPFMPKPWPHQVEAWLAAVESVAAKEVAGADRLAWAAYQAGRMDLAQRWVDRAAGDSPLGDWIKAKLLLRQGKVEPAAPLLAKAAKAFPADERWISPGGYWWTELSRPVALSPAERVSAELGVLKLSRGQCVDSLDLLLRGGFWTDAAYVAERVLTTDELLDYATRRHGTAPTPQPPMIEPPVRVPSTQPAVRDRLEHLLARRLTREGRWKEARAFFPEDLRPGLDAYIEGIRAGHDATRSAPERGRSLWQAAQVARSQGMELLGSELDPDWNIWSGDFDFDPFAAVRFEQKAGAAKILPAGKDERQRVTQHDIQPRLRFHYRYIAAGHAWDAAQLLPDDSEETAQILCTAGGWLKDRDPKAADRFYKALVQRCGKTTLGRQAAELHWFPK